MFIEESREKEGRNISLLSWVNRLEDPRICGMVTYPLEEMVFAAVVGIVCGAEDWEEVSEHAESRIDFLRRVLPYEHGVASGQTFRKLFRRLEGSGFNAMFMDWAQYISARVSGVVAVDGKMSRGSQSKDRKDAGFYAISAFAHAQGLVLGQQRVEEGKSSEYKAIPELLDRLVLTGAIVTIDAAGTYAPIVQKIIEREGHYVLALKENQPNLYNDVEEFFIEQEEAGWREWNGDFYEECEKGHGRVERRRYWVAYDVAEWLRLKKGWESVRSVIKVEATRDLTSKEDPEVRFYLSDLHESAQTMASYVRSHWGIENQLHWVMDVIMKEDQSRVRKEYGAENLRTLRLFAFNLIKKCPLKKSFKLKRKRASWRNDYLAELLSIPYQKDALTI